jgi:hypothetical protein
MKIRFILNGTLSYLQTESTSTLLEADVDDADLQEFVNSDNDTSASDESLRDTLNAFLEGCDAIEEYSDTLMQAIRQDDSKEFDSFTYDFDSDIIIQNFDEILPVIREKLPTVEESSENAGAFLVIIVADYNDGDFMEQTSYITRWSTKDQLTRLLNKIRTVYSSQIPWKTGEHYTSDFFEKHYPMGFFSFDEVELLTSFCPKGDSEYPGIHTIHKITIHEITRTQML